MRARRLYVAAEKWGWLVATPIFAFTALGRSVPLIAGMSAYALYLSADARLEASRARREARGDDA